MDFDGQQQEAAIALMLAGESDSSLARLRDSVREPVRLMLAELLPTRPTTSGKAALVQLMLDEEPIVSTMAAHSAGKIGSEMLPLLAQWMNDLDSSVRGQVEIALKTMGAPAVPWLLDLVSHAEGQARELAVLVLTDIGTPAAVFGLAERGVEIQPRK
jgi:HEAT repeat protein